MDIKDLKVGDKVYIREDLKNGFTYGNRGFIDEMDKGLLEVSFVSIGNTLIQVHGNPFCDYTPEMIDWEKTRVLNNSSCFKEITQSGENRNETTKAVTHDGREIIVKNNNEKNDVEKAVMLLMLKKIGFTYGDVKREVEKVKVKWRPAENDRYYYIREIGDISSCFWSELSWDYYRFVFNNCFKTKEEAEEKLEKIKEVLKGE